MKVFVHDDATRAASQVAETVAEAIRHRQGRFSFGLAGGSTPGPVYGELRNTDLDWEAVDGWLSDERWVAPQSHRSNGRMVAELLFDHVPAKLHRPKWGDASSAERSAADYETVLMGLEASRPDLILLGMGDDGHTASLFPGSDALSEKERLFVANTIPGTSEVRLTATYPLLDMAKRVVFLVVGEDKAAALQSSLAGDTPAGQVKKGSDQVEWHVDRSAASQL